MDKLYLSNKMFTFHHNGLHFPRLLRGLQSHTYLIPDFNRKGSQFTINQEYSGIELSKDNAWARSLMLI